MRLLTKNKKGDWNMLIMIIVLTLSFIIIAGLIIQFLGKAEGKTAETLCRGSVAARTRTHFEPAGGAAPNIYLSPLLCKTLDAKLPEQGYLSTKEEIMRNMADLSAKCWWIFGEGLVNADDIVGERGWFSKDKCYVCYTVNIKDIRDSSSITKEELEAYFSEAIYKIEEGVSQCTPDGKGICIPKECTCGEACGAYPDYDTKRWPNFFSEGSCEENQKCCYNRKNECEDKGGKCFDIRSSSCKEKSSENNEYEYPQWKCEASTETCCLNKEKAVTYTNYIQGNGGYITVQPSIDEFKKRQETYAIAMVFDTPVNLRWDTDLSKYTGHRIILSKLNDVKDACAIQKDIGGK